MALDITEFTLEDLANLFSTTRIAIHQDDPMRYDREMNRFFDRLHPDALSRLGLEEQRELWYEFEGLAGESLLATTEADYARSTFLGPAPGFYRDEPTWPPARTS